ncbi:hypothetical protein Bbelb_416200, partial [Branchiostoma belcheri]
FLQEIESLKQEKQQLEEQLHTERQRWELQLHSLETALEDQSRTAREQQDSSAGQVDELRKQVAALDKQIKSNKQFMEYFRKVDSRDQSAAFMTLCRDTPAAAAAEVDAPRVEEEVRLRYSFRYVKAHKRLSCGKADQKHFLAEVLSLHADRMRSEAPAEKAPTLQLSPDLGHAASIRSGNSGWGLLLCGRNSRSQLCGRRTGLSNNMFNTSGYQV